MGRGRRHHRGLACSSPRGAHTVGGGKGLHVLCEKPMADSVAACRRMNAAAADAGVQLGLGFVKRFDPSIALAHELVTSGAIGEPYAMAAEWDQPKAYVTSSLAWRDQAAGGGGHLTDHGTHYIDLARWFLGEVHTVFGVVGTINREREVDDTAFAAFVHERGAVSTLRVTKVSYVPQTERLTLFGSDATLLVENSSRSSVPLEPMVVRLYRAGPGYTDPARFLQPHHETLLIEDRTPHPGQSWDSLLRWEHFGAQLESFASAVQSRVPFSPSGEDGERATELVNAVYASAVRSLAVEVGAGGLPEPTEQFFRQYVERGKMWSGSRPGPSRPGN